MSTSHGEETSGRKAPARTIWHFGPGGAEGAASLRKVLGGKGANLAEMCNIGLPVPPGFTISTDVCRRYNENGGRLPSDVLADVREAIGRLERDSGKGFGDGMRPLLVSVRSGAAISMPGMMDTVLNLGLTAAATEGLAKLSSNPRFALDARRRFIQMFGNVVAGLGLERFETILREEQARAGASSDAALDAEALERVVARYLEAYADGTGEAFPEDPYEQLERSISAVFGSWMGARAVEYRRIHKIRDLVGTAVNVQVMVFGNLGPDSGTGVCFTRDPATGENVFYGEYLMNAQGEDVVAGIRTPEPLSGLSTARPNEYEELVGVRKRLEQHYRQIQDIEFTIEDGRLYILQTRVGKTTAAAAVRMAVEMVEEGLITRSDAVARLTAEQVDQLLHPQFDPQGERNVIAKGLPASPGAVSGKVVFTAEDAKERAATGDRVILVRNETSPEDVGGMDAAQGILTSTGGMTSHAAVVARGMGKCCIAGAGTVRIDPRSRVFRAGEATVREGDVISLDGASGEVMLGEVPTIPAEQSGHFQTLLAWSDGIARMHVRANADTPRDASIAREFGAQGIGLCRTEHMFFGEDRIAAMREMILAETADARVAALAKLLPYQREDFEGILEAMDGLPVTIRLLDPPLHEFLPHDEEQARAVAEALGVGAEEVLDRAARLQEMNPMLGHRGCRLGITDPEIYEMQVRAIYEAAANVLARGRDPRPEVMIPLVGSEREFTILRERLTQIAMGVLEEQGSDLPLVFGTMIEVPRAALRSDRIAATSDFFSFGTNDLTQLTFGFSRDDVGSFLPQYIEYGVLPDEPFQTLDTEGVGELVRLAVARGRGVRPDLKIGICGEHGGDPRSIAFCETVGLDYVSCSPFRVPVARLASAQAVLATTAGETTTEAAEAPAEEPAGAG
ncbi:MAG: pyruvate, phosphate dikinase [Planctomycetota bacterium]|jgi:pyruvate,orthophosphate dikinase